MKSRTYTSINSVPQYNFGNICGGLSPLLSTEVLSKNFILIGGPFLQKSYLAGHWTFKVILNLSKTSMFINRLKILTILKG